MLQVSTDPIHSIKAWVESFKGMPYPLLSDFWPHGAVGRAYGIFNDNTGFDARSVFLIDAQGIVRHSHVCEPGTIPESRDLLPRLREL